MASYAAPEDVVNAALAEIGWERAVGDIYEGSRAARLALRLYGEARDEVLAARDWRFARARALLSAPLASQTAAYQGNWVPAAQPPPPWQYEFALPADFIRDLDLTAMPSAPGVQYDPKPALWEVADDWTRNTAGGANGQKVLLCNISPALLVYTARMLDPAQWEPLFTASLVSSLGRRFAAALAKNPQALAAAAPG